MLSFTYCTFIYVYIFLFCTLVKRIIKLKLKLKRKVNVFNDNFASQATVPNSYSAEIPFLPRSSSDCLSVITADEEMVRNLMSSVNISKATGYHGISDKIIIHFSEGLCKPFTSLINTSFRLGQYPSAWKLGNVLPLLKKRSPSTED